ncbi:MAG TPA: hypothetical protein VGP93_05000, partial [Polyangiaceae bacterium]|nr:hypothetical protein [Polyangiaceae bacterium]
MGSAAFESPPDPPAQRGRVLSRFESRQLFPLSLGFAALLAALLISATPANPTNPAPTRLQAGDTGSRLRIGGEANDPVLLNPEATAIVRSYDGALVDFFRNGAFVPTLDQLGTLTDIDGLWDLLPVVHVFSTGATLIVPAQRVNLKGDAIETLGSIALGNARVEVTTLYRLDQTRPLVRMSSTFHSLAGTLPHDVGFGYSIRWGNVSYYVDGSASPRTYFAGQTKWVGRHGAGGDLLVRGRGDMWAQFSSQGPGFEGALLALDRVSLGAANQHTVERELSYEPLPLPEPLPPKSKPGHIVLRVRDELGRPLPAKLRLEREGHSEPLFPDHGGIDGSYQFLWTGNGLLEADLPPGKYHGLLTSGIERNARSLKFQLWPGARRVLAAELKRVV